MGVVGSTQRTFRCPPPGPGALFQVKQKPAAVEDKLFEGMPPEVQKLAKQARKEKREKQRREWWSKNGMNV